MTSTMQSDTEVELGRYLEEKEIKSLFVSIVESLLLEKPDDPICFMVQYLKVCMINGSIIYFVHELSNSMTCLLRYNFD
jgi:hypothetical protein